MEVPKGPQRLLYRGTHRSSKPILWGYPWILKTYTMKVPMGPQSLCYEGTHGSSKLILGRYSWVLIARHAPNRNGLGLVSLSIEFGFEVGFGY